MLINIPMYTLNNGHKMPAVGLGCALSRLHSYPSLNPLIARCWMGQPGCEDRAYAMCLKAIKVRVGFWICNRKADPGFSLATDTSTLRQDTVRQIDTLFAHKFISGCQSMVCMNRKRKGRGKGYQRLRRIPHRFLCDYQTPVRSTPLNGLQVVEPHPRGTDHGCVSDAFEKSLAALDIGYIDLYLVHWPQAVNAAGNALPINESPTVAEVWADMEKLLETGKVHSIGVSNYSIKILNALLPGVKVVPAVNQVQLHPYLPQHELKKYCKDKGIHLTAYSSLGSMPSFPAECEPR
jgi:hypothetical protein